MLSSVYSSFLDFEHLLKTNTIGPTIVAQKLLTTGIPIGMIVFMSSSSGSTTDFREFEDGYDDFQLALPNLIYYLQVCCLRRVQGRAQSDAQGKQVAP